MGMCGMDGDGWMQRGWICSWTYGGWRGDMDAGMDASMDVDARSSCSGYGYYYSAVSGLVDWIGWGPLE